ncbi:hypothetical protein L917_12862 [Phytophthora nicotianae]|uniref:EGF-like domain-containing protein n=2 Tax=Phytophthora nicotianae TaxID=4792 RepID=W2KS68_PHYNI|nr:hypothetical protein L917_12862 [Phytophthora nicotianae]ETO69988.1 hypothetical protein F444_13509 [Phytophthora nicotianae P1976]
MSRSWHVVVFISLLLTVTTGQNDEVQSGCEVCANTSDCSRAYRGEPGQFCGNWLDRQSDRRPCCCPENAVCKVSNYACNCGYSSQYANDGGIGLVWLWWLLGSLALLLCCCGCCFMASKRLRDRRLENEIPVAAPVAEDVSSQPYGAPSTAYASAPGYASARPEYGRYYGQSRGRGGMSAGTGAALGGTAGLLGGFLLGDALADHGGDGGGGFDGGGDFGGGDFGGDF